LLKDRFDFNRYGLFLCLFSESTVFNLFKIELLFCFAIFQQINPLSFYILNRKIVKDIFCYYITDSGCAFVNCD